MLEIIGAIKRLFNSCKTRAIGCINSLDVTSDSRTLLSRLRGQRFPPTKPWSFVIRDICTPSRSLHRSCSSPARRTEIPRPFYPTLATRNFPTRATKWMEQRLESRLPRRGLPSSSFSPIFVKLIRWRCQQCCDAKTYIMSLLLYTRSARYRTCLTNTSLKITKT